MSTTTTQVLPTKIQTLARFTAFGSADNVSEVVHVTRDFMPDGSLQATVSRYASGESGTQNWLFTGKRACQDAMDKALTLMGWEASVLGEDEEG